MQLQLLKLGSPAKPISSKTNLNLEAYKFSWKKKTHKKPKLVELFKRERERENESLMKIGSKHLKKDKPIPLPFSQTQSKIIKSHCRPSFLGFQRERESLFYLILCDMLACADLCGLERLYLVLTHR